MSVISSARALPCDMNDEKQYNYLLIPGSIQNSELTESGWDAPVLVGCPPPVSDCPPDTNCEIRLHPLELTSNTCGDLVIPSTYYLPSLAFVVKNNVNGTKTIVDPYSASEFLTGDPFAGEPCSTSIVKCPAPEGESFDSEVPLYQDGILSAVYTLSIYNSYQDPHQKTVYEYVICPYAPTDIFKLPNPCMPAPIPGVPDFYTPKEIMGTQPFCLGSREHPCVCVSLLLHGALREVDDPSLVGCVSTDLFWVGVKLYYTNIAGEMCHHNPICLNITHAPDSAYMDCYTPYFAKTMSVVDPTPSSLVSPPCGQTPAQGTKSCPTPITVTPGESLHGKVYLGCGVTADEEPACQSPEIIHISQSVDVSDLIHDPCSVYIVLIPNTLETLA